MSDDYRDLIDRMVEHRFLGWWDLVDPATGALRDFTLEISAVTRGELASKPGSKQTKATPLLTLKGAQKQLVLNATNRRTLSELYGKRTSLWIGKRVTLYADPSVSFGRSVVGGIRIRPTIPQPKIATDAGVQAQPVNQAAREAQNQAAAEAAEEDK